MKDLRNERAEVVNHIRNCNYDPVNAEGFGPNGTQSWPRIEKEIESSDIMILVLGDKYGWTPDEGPQSHLGLSVTHLEVKLARDLGITILPFLKKLDYESDRTSDDAKKRDEFRQEIRDWKDGYFTSDFDLASDLVDSVGNALMDLLGNSFYDDKVRERSTVVTNSTLSLTDSLIKNVEVTERLQIPRSLIEAVRNRNAVLFTGSGISLPSGLPSAFAIAQRLVQLVHEVDPEYTINPTGASFAAIATDLAALKGQEFLENAIKSIIDSPQGVFPSVAHKKAAILFDQILTTNYDSIFEDAVSLLGLPHLMVANEIDEEIPNKSIVKLHGSIDREGSLLLTENDVFMFDKSRSNLWEATLNILKSKVVVVVGASLHDPSIIRLFREAGDSLNGYFIAPQLWKSTPKRVQEFNLQCIKTDANTFMTRLEELL